MSEILVGRAKEVVARVSAESMSADDARALHAMEVAGKNRKSVRDALEEKYGETQIEGASPGLARAPSGAAPPQTDPSGGSEPLDVQVAAPPTSADWVVKSWHGHPLYVCARCGRDSFDLLEIRAHVESKHPRASTPVTP